MWLAALLTIPLHCVEPLLRVYAAHTPWSLGENRKDEVSPYNQFLETGQFDSGGCTVGTGNADIVVDKEDAKRVVAVYKRDQSSATLAGWVLTLLTKGCVDLPEDVRVCLDGWT